MKKIVTENICDDDSNDSKSDIIKCKHQVYPLYFASNKSTFISLSNQFNSFSDVEYGFMLYLFSYRSCVSAIMEAPLDAVIQDREMMMELAV